MRTSENKFLTTKNTKVHEEMLGSFDSSKNDDCSGWQVWWFVRRRCRAALDRTAEGGRPYV